MTYKFYFDFYSIKLFLFYLFSILRPPVLQATSKEDAALGCLLGGLCGEALGGPLEKLDRSPTMEEVELAFSMCGGGVHHLAPGQITDDGELTLCLAYALADSKQFDIEKIARKYSEWMKTNPFDIGSTIGNFF